jgi:ATP-dependent helicase/nuclease subunit A
MTVHGAKGLEAPIVFLVDAGGAPVAASHAPRMVEVPIPGRDPDLHAALAWVRPADRRPAAVIDAVSIEKRRAEDEYRRLLYVAMTRAADRLYVCGYSKLRAPSPDCWHQVIERSLLATGKAEVRHDATGAIAVHCWRSTDLPPLPGQEPDVVSPVVHPAPDWLTRAPPQSVPIGRLSPSTVLDSLVLNDIAAKDAREPVAATGLMDLAMRPLEIELLRGTLIHKLLEVLPDMALDDRRPAAERYLARAGQALPHDQRDAIADEVLGLLGTPDFADLFLAGSRAEVPIVGEVITVDGRRFAVSGQIDRLSVTPNHVLILDYKTNRQPPRQVPDAYLAQMALYRHLLKAIFPTHPIRAAILWTSVPGILEIPSGALDMAAKKISIL